MREPDYIVIRGTNDPYFDGRWYDRANLTRADLRLLIFNICQDLLTPTAAFEQRKDGTIAQVWRPE